MAPCMAVVFFQRSATRRLALSHNRFHWVLAKAPSKLVSSAARVAPNFNAIMGNGSSTGILAAAIIGLAGWWWVTAASPVTRLEGTTAGRRLLSGGKDVQLTTSSTTQLPPPHTLFVWDFDWTVVNCNSDEYIPAQFLGDENTSKGFRKLYKSGNDWHECVEKMVQQAMEEASVSTQQVLDAAGRMPYLTGVREALDAVDNKRRDSENGLATTDQMILSDGNTIFIGKFLEVNGLIGHFGRIVSNTGLWIPSGSNPAESTKHKYNNNKRLCVVHQSQQYGGHDCQRCSANLCKSQALTNTLAEWFTGMENDVSTSKRPRIIYVGDGANDACPVLQVLGKGDVMLARAGKKRKFANDRAGPETDEEATRTTNEKAREGSPFGIVPELTRARKGNPSVVPKCQVLEWSTGEELKHLVEELLADIK